MEGAGGHKRRSGNGAAALLEPGESVLAEVSLDLSAGLRFASGLLVLTDRRLVWREGAEQGGPVAEWPLSDVERLDAQDRGGLGTLEARGRAALLGRWNYTLKQARDVTSLCDAHARLRSGGLPGAAAAPAVEEAPEAVAREEEARIGTLLRLLRFARPHAAWLALGLLLTLASTGAGLIPPLMTWPILDDVLTPYQEQVSQERESAQLTPAQRVEALDRLREEHRQPFSTVPLYLLGMLGAALAAWVLGWGQGWVLARLGERIAADLRNATYGHLQALSLDYFSAKRTGDLVSRISSDTDRICFFLSDSLTDFVTDVLMISGAVVMLFYMDWVLALATLATFPLVAWLTVATRRKLTEGFLRSSRAWADMTSILADTIPGVRVVKAFAQEKREIERFAATNDRIVAANDRVNRLWTFFWPMVALLNNLGLIVAWSFGVWRVYDQAITVGVLTAFLAYITRFYARLESMSRMAGRTQRAAASAQRIFEVLDRSPSVPEPAHPVVPGKLRGEIELKGVGFRFGNRRVLDNVSLTIKPGEMIGVVGPTGSGKSTLVNLICRFYDVSEGTIRVDGTDIRSFPVVDFRRNIGVVLQDPFLFFGTIADNIAYGKPSAERGEILSAARAARAHEFILKLPDAYDSVVGERGQTLSGGERQRVSIARALLIDPRILILDEATSAVDTHTEAQIQEALDILIKGRTTIAIAHRLSTLHGADRIIVLDNGRIVETGTHAQLMEANGLYRSLYEVQAREESEKGRSRVTAGHMPTAQVPA
jgi:ATP-binding cassette subfamily B protein